MGLQTSRLTVFRLWSLLQLALEADQEAALVVSFVHGQTVQQRRVSIQMACVGQRLNTVGSGTRVQMPVLSAFRLHPSLQLVLLEVEEGAVKEAPLVVTIQDVSGRIEKRRCVWTCFACIERRCSTGVGTALWLILGGFSCAASVNSVF
ncbi:hypothetical protein MRX96_016918 [Rhipicephalus microplus]